MLKITDANNFRRTLAGLCLIAAPLVGLIGALITPQFTGDIGEELATISDQPVPWLIGNFLTLISFLLLTPAVLGLVHLLSKHSVTLGHIGGGLVLLGAFFHAAIIGFALVEVPLVESGIERTQMVAFAHQMYEGAAFLMILFPFLAFYLGSIILSVGVWRARVAPLWVAAVIVAATPSEFFGPEVLSPELMFAFLLGGFGWLGLKVLRMSDAQWEKARVSYVEEAAVRAEAGVR
jgi:hypothetical protein